MDEARARSLHADYAIALTLMVSTNLHLVLMSAAEDHTLVKKRSLYGRN